MCQLTYSMLEFIAGAQLSALLALHLLFIYLFVAPFWYISQSHHATPSQTPWRDLMTIGRKSSSHHGRLQSAQMHLPDLPAKTQTKREWWVNLWFIYPWWLNHVGYSTVINPRKYTNASSIFMSVCPNLTALNHCYCVVFFHYMQKKLYVPLSFVSCSLYLFLTRLEISISRWLLPTLIYICSVL